MSDKEKTVGQSIHDAVEKTKDAAREAMHRSTAEAEHTRREVDGDAMSTSEKVASAANEVKNRTQAEIDKIKRESR